MKRIFIAAAFIAAAAAANSAPADLLSGFATAEQFDAFYVGVVDQLAKAGVQSRQLCFTAPYHYCANQMSYGNSQQGYLEAFNISIPDSPNLQEVCFGGDTSRRCAFSNGTVYDQVLENGVWQNSRTIADGFGG